MEIIPNHRYLLRGREVTCTSKWAQGNHFTYTFSNGYVFNGPTEPMFASGELKALEITKVTDDMLANKRVEIPEKNSWRDSIRKPPSPLDDKIRR